MSKDKKVVFCDTFCDTLGVMKKRKYVINRNGIYWFQKKTPADLVDNFGRFIRFSLKTDSLQKAAQEALDLNKKYESLFKAMRVNGSEDEIATYKQAIEITKSLGFDYIPSKDLVDKNLYELVRRYEKILEIDAPANVAKSLLGVIDRPKIKVSDFYEEYYKLKKHDLTDKNKEQMRLFKNSMLIATKLFIKAVTDKDIMDISRQDALNLREYGFKEYQDGKLAISTFNKYMANLSAMFNAINDGLRLNLTNPFAGIRLKEKGNNSRDAYPIEFIQDILLNEDKLKGLNNEAKWLIFALVDTGARPSELCNLMPDQIFLNEPIPYIFIKENANGTLKTAQSERKIPLVGTALRAFQECPNGFPRYAQKNNSATSAIGKYLRENNMTYEGCSLYSLRHTFHDRLRKINIPPDMQRQITGHAVKDIHETYGNGYSLEDIKEWLKKIVF